MAKTVVQKVDSPDPDVTIFKISGTLGFHENKVLVKFFEECSSRKIRKLILDFSELSSLGGGCAKIIREASGKEAVEIRIAGASHAVQSFLQGKDGAAVRFASDVNDALADFLDENRPRPDERDAAPLRDAGKPVVRESRANISSAVHAVGSSPAGTSSGERREKSPSRAAVGYADDVLTEVDDLLGVREPAPSPARATPASASRERAAPESVSTTAPSDEVKELKRKIVHYRALFSLMRDFSRIEDKSKLLDAFLLTIIAQVGVESAAFLELGENEFAAVCWKGFETADPRSLDIQCDEVDMDTWLQSSEIFPLAEAPIADDAKARVQKWDLPFAAPFIVHERFRGIVLLGKPIRRALDADSWEFLSMMFDQVAIAYENSRRLEKQNARTLGLVQSLISMIESNTASRGTTELLMDLTYAVALRMHYPEEHSRDLLYGTVLRDIGMLNTNLVVRNPRELQPEEWEAIKQHPLEGARMIEKMGFSSHTCEIVLYHHERYNGEGYPEGLSGAQIPLGARIISVVESYAAMLHDRPHRPAISPEEALNTLAENWGLRYDPEVVTAFVQTIEEETRTGKITGHRGIDLIKS
ncbi:MAG: putative hdig domain protein [Candidatus Krumholzibacteriota bacterium]|nr:putative hdig domain protein [Candidatus Krumholzibacteriota bacterium]